MAGKKNQVARNARERKRVDQVNNQFNVLRDRLQSKNSAKKLSKAETLRQAARYIRQLEMMLSANPQQPSVSSTTADYAMCQPSDNTPPTFPSSGKDEYSMYLPPDYPTMSQPQCAMPQQNGASFGTSPTSSVSSSSYSPTQFYHPHPHHHHNPHNPAMPAANYYHPQ